MLGLVAGAGLAWAQGTAFSYQGQLTDGAAAANGTYDLTFSLWNAATAGDQQGATLTQTAVGVTNGLFTATLDFGAQFSGQGRWLEIAVRTNGTAAFTTLAERQPVLPTPYAIHAATASSAGTATTATTVTGSVPASQLTGTLSAAQIPSLDASKITSGMFTGHGGGLTNIHLEALVQPANPVVAWGYQSSDLLSPPADLSNVVNLSGGGLHVLALRADGSVVGWGDNTDGRAVAPVGLTHAVKISAGRYHNLALRPDGTVVAWGSNGFQQTSVPSGLAGVTAVAAGERFSLALKSDGQVVGWGGVTFQTPFGIVIPDGLPGLSAIAAGDNFWVAVKVDGSVGAWVANGFSRSVPAGLTNVVAVAAGGIHSLALKSDGTVVAWAVMSGSQIEVPAGLTNVVSIAAGDSHSLALKSDGTVVAWGEADVPLVGVGEQATVPVGLTEVEVITATRYASFALRTDPVVPAQVALVDRGNFFAGTVSALGFSGDGSGLTSLNASALSSGTVPVAQIPNLDAGKITTGTLAAAQIPSLDASKVTTGMFTAAQIPNLDAGKIAAGTVSDARLSANVARLNGSPEFTSDVRLDDHDLYLRGGTDNNHGLGWFGGGGRTFAGATVDGPVLHGFLGGALGSTKTAQKIALRWNDSQQVAIGGGTPDSPLTVAAAGAGLSAEIVTRFRNTTAGQHTGVSIDALDGQDAVLYLGNNGVREWDLRYDDGSGELQFRTQPDNVARLQLSRAGTLSVDSPAGTQAASITGTRTGNHNSPLMLVENKDTTTSSSPALRVIGRGGADEGALSVSAVAGPIARFGNSGNWVATIENNGDIDLRGIVYPSSDRNVKAGFAPVDVESVLAKVAALPLTTWHYTNDVAATPHLGPMAQDFHAAFGLGRDDKTIGTVDADGVALAAIQGLHRKTEVLAAENAELRGELTDLRTLVLQLQQQLNANRP